jgi:photosystem II stability/assembly factor-like uncharacterized protein
MHGCAVAELLHSADGGVSWSPASLANGHPDECGSNGIALSAAPDGAAWASIGRNGGACAPPLGLVYRYGAFQAGAGLPGWQQLPPWQLAEVRSLTAVSHDVAYAISDQGALSRTGDGGQHWTQLLPAPVPTGQLAAASSTTALAAQDANDAGAILRSADGGRGWRQVADLPGVITQLDFPSSGHAAAVTYSADSTPAWKLWTSTDAGSRWAQSGSLPVTNGVIEGPWMSADGHGLLLTVASGNAWQPANGGTGPVQEWTTDDWGATWTPGALLPLGRDTLDGPASFAFSGGWSGWLSIATASYQQELAAIGSRTLTPLPGKPPADDMRLIRPGIGFAWGVNDVGRASTLVIYRTTNNGRAWQHFQVALPASAQVAPLLAFSDQDHGWLVLGSATWRTADGGRTWHLG